MAVADALLVLNEVQQRRRQAGSKSGTMEGSKELFHVGVQTSEAVKSGKFMSFVAQILDR